MIRYLYGPVSASFAKHHLRSFRDRGECLAFDAEGKTDLRIEADDSWEKVAARFPPGWKPDFIAAHFPRSIAPSALWSAGLPIVGIVQDWSLSWHYYRRRLRSCEMVIADERGAATLAHEGIAHVESATWFAPEDDSTAPPREHQRDIDVLFSGNLNPALHAETLPWLGRIVRMGKRWRIAVRTERQGGAYRVLLRRARLVVHFPTPGQSEHSLYEAIAAGALVFRHDHPTASPSPFVDGQEIVRFGEDADLESLIERYLGNEQERATQVANAQRRLEGHRFDRVWPQLVSRIETELPVLRQRTQQRSEPRPKEELLTRTWQALSSPTDKDSTLVRDLERHLAEEPGSAPLHHALGLALTRASAGTIPAPALGEVATEHFRRAIERDPNHLSAGACLAESLVASGRKKEGIEQARRTLSTLERGLVGDSGLCESGTIEPGWSPYRVMWERCGWANAGEPAAEIEAKRNLLRWQLQRFLALHTKQIVHHYEETMALPGAAGSEASLALALANTNQPLEALPHARRALERNPFDPEIARLLHQALGYVGDRAGQRRLIEDRRLFFRASPQLVPAEPWFFENPPSDDELTSIIILCCNEVAFTRQCVESVLRNTRSPYELIFVDNASSDGTAEYLREAESAKGPQRVQIITNDKNLGFGVGCNQGMKSARGRFFVFLNNDTVVPPGWLDGLIAWVNRGWPRIGLVGPVSNYAPPPQFVRTSYASVEEMDAFAARRKRLFKERSLKVQRLTGFCLLVRREVLAQVGGFDESFGVGFFEDDDLGLRALEAGFQLVVALDVFVHHYGSRTFSHLAIKTSDLLEENMARFRGKWGAEQVAHYHLPPKLAEPPSGVPLLPWTSATATSQGPDSVAETDKMPASPKAPRVTLSMIVKNEEANLPACLTTVADLFDEIVIADTGSSDRTREIASQFGAKVVEFPWIDDFGAARNASLKEATGKWVVWLDADDRLTEENRRRLKKLFERLEDGLDCHSLKVRSLINKSNETYQSLEQVRLFPNHPDVRWEYRIHEQIFPSIRRLGGVIQPTDVVIDHVGYQDHGMRRKKLERNFRLIEMDHRDRPSDAFTLFYLGWTSMDLGKVADAIVHLKKAVDVCGPDSSLARKLHALLAQAHRRQGTRADAMEVCRAGLDRYPDDAELLNEWAMLSWEKKDWPAVERHLTRLLTTRSVSYFTSLDEGLKGYRTRHLLGLVFLDQERWSEAEVQWRAVVAEKPRFMAAWQGMGNLFVKQRRWPDLEQVIQTLNREGLFLDAGIFRGQGCLARKEFTAARQVFEETIRRFPKAVRPRVLLTHVLLQEGRDFEAIEAAFKEALQVDPNNPGLKHNWAVFQKESRRSPASGSTQR